MDVNGCTYKKAPYKAWLRWSENGRSMVSENRVYVDVSGHSYVFHKGFMRSIDALFLSGYEVFLYER